MSQSQISKEELEVLKKATFALETVAHLQGRERDLLPLCDAARAVISKVEKVWTEKEERQKDAINAWDKWCTHWEGCPHCHLTDRKDPNTFMLCSEGLKIWDEYYKTEDLFMEFGRHIDG